MAIETRVAEPIDFKDVRYIKLGRGGCWNDISLDRQEIHFGYGTITHPLALNLNYEAIRTAQIDRGRHNSAASDDARAVIDFYSLGPDCLWITFARGHLWWTFSQPEVVWLGGNSSGADAMEHGFRFRKCTGWSNHDRNGQPLTIDSLSTSLTKVAGYRRTLCRVQASEDYLRRRINCLIDPLIQEAKAAQETMVNVLEVAIAKLHQTDFETLADVMFVRSGWHRITALGGRQEFIDLALEQPATGEIAAVQVKSQATQAILNEYIAQFDAVGSYSRLFFVCHTASTLAAPARDDIHIWQGKSLSKLVLKLGLVDWVFAKIA